MTTPTTQAYDLKDSPPALSATVPAPPPPVMMVRRDRRLQWWGKFLTWAMVVVFLAGGTRWALCAGLAQRDEMWQYTHSIRFKEDISRGYQFGNATLRYAETQAGLDPLADAYAGQSADFLRKHDRPDLIGKQSPTFRRLTIRELAGGIVGYIDSVVDAGGDYDLDYPPLRLAVMTLWVQHIQRTHPELDTFPQERADDTDLVQEEDIAGPVLNFNTFCEGAAAVGMFLLVWLWVHRSFKPVGPLAIGKWIRKLRGTAKQPLTLRRARQCDGVGQSHTEFSPSWPRRRSSGTPTPRS